MVGSGEYPAPDFLIVGAAKAGTTYLYHLLGQHPSLYLPDRKEPHHFAHHDLKSKEKSGKPTWKGPAPVAEREEYLALFEEASQDQLSGEASTSYLPSEEAPYRVAEVLPHAKIITLLRDPVERAYSQYLHQVRDGREPADSFRAAINDEQRRYEEGWGPFWTYFRTGLYGKQLARWFEVNDETNVHCVKFDQFIESPHEILSAIWAFLNIPDPETIDYDVPQHPSGVPRLGPVYRFLSGHNPVTRPMTSFVPDGFKNALKKALGRMVQKPSLDPMVERKLRSRYVRDIETLENLLDWDLASWKPGGAGEGNDADA